MYQLIVFDVDGTLYNLDDVAAENYAMQVAFYAEKTGISKEEAEKIFEKNSILPYKSEAACSATEFFLRTGINADEWRAYRDSHTSPQSIRKETAVSNSLLKEYAALTKIILLSSNTASNIQKTLEWLGIEVNLFDAVFCSSTKLNGQLFSKAAMFSSLLERYHLKPGEVLSIGDRYATDIKPLVDMGGDGVLIHIPANLQAVYNDLLSGKLGTGTDTPYRFFRK